MTTVETKELMVINTPKICTPRPKKLRSCTIDITKSDFGVYQNDEFRKSPLNCFQNIYASQQLNYPKLKAESWFDLCSSEQIEEDFLQFSILSEEIKSQKELLNILRDSTNANSFDEAYENEQIIERVKNPFFKNLE